MLKKRIIFTLLFYENFFTLSRNFRLQKVGDINWLKKNYKFNQTTDSIDELIILNTRPSIKNRKSFIDTVIKLSSNCFIPISVGGGIDELNYAKILLRNGADKIVINSILFHNEKKVIELANNFGKQCIVASIDYKINKKNGFEVYVNSGKENTGMNLQQYLEKVLTLPIGEILLNSIDKDGTGQGMEISVLDLIPKNTHTPLIFSGGVGKWEHIYEIIKSPKVDAVATANLFNFVNNGLELTRDELLKKGIKIPSWKNEKFKM